MTRTAVRAVRSVAGTVIRKMTPRRHFRTERATGTTVNALSRARMLSFRGIRAVMARTAVSAVCSVAGLTSVAVRAVRGTVRVRRTSARMKTAIRRTNASRFRVVACVAFATVRAVRAVATAVMRYVIGDRHLGAGFATGTAVLTFVAASMLF